MVFTVNIEVQQVLVKASLKLETIFWNSSHKTIIEILKYNSHMMRGEVMYQFEVVF